MAHLLQLGKREYPTHSYREIMYIYSVTLKIEKDCEKEWVQFMEYKHIDDVLKTGYFKSCSMRKLVSAEDNETVTYNMQYSIDSEEQYLSYQEHAAPLLQGDVLSRFQGKFSAARAFYEVTFEA